MKRLSLIFLILLAVLPALAQAPIRRQFFTTNTDPIVEVVAGSNATVQASTPAANIRRFTVNGTGSGSGQTNDTFVAGLTNVVVVTNSSGGKTLYSIGGLTDTNIVTAIARAQTNGLATTNFVLGSQVWTNDAGTIKPLTVPNDTYIEAQVSSTNFAEMYLVAGQVPNWGYVDVIANTNNAFITIGQSSGGTVQSLNLGAINGADPLPIWYRVNSPTADFRVRTNADVVTTGTYYGNGAGLTNLPGGSQVWTNDGTYTWLNGQPTPNPAGTTKGPSFFFTDQGFFAGTNVMQDVTLPSANTMWFPYVVSMIDSNDLPYNGFNYISLPSESYAYYSGMQGRVQGNKDTGRSELVFNAYLTNSVGHEIGFITAPAANDTEMYLKTNLVKVFRVDKNGSVESKGIYYGDGSGLTNLPSSGTGSSNITDNAYYAVARNLTVNTNAEINNLTVTNLTVDSGSGIGYLSLENSGTNIISLNGTNGTIISVTNIAQQFVGDGTGLTNVPFAIFTNYAASQNYTNVGALAFGTNLYGMTSFWTYASVPIVGVVPIFNFGIDTNTVITTNGGTFTGTILDASVSSTAPANNQLVTAQWVRGLFAGAGASYYTTTNINNTFTNKDIVTTNTQIYEFSTNIPVYSRRIYIGPTNGAYIGAVVTTNTFQQLLSGVTVNAYLEAQNGTGTGGPQVKPEIYVSYDRTNWFGDWDSQPQYIPEGATNLYSWVVSNPTYVSTNAAGFYVQRRFKMVTQTTPAASDVYFHLGTNRPSHITLSADSGTSGNAYLAANQTFTGTNTFSTWLAGNGGGLTNLPARSVGITVDGGGSAITAGTKGYISVPYSGAIVSCTLMAQPSGSIEFRIWRTNSADGSFPPTAAGAIGTNVLTSDNYNVDATLSNWTKGINAGDVLGFNIPSAATSITNCTLQLKIQP